MRIQNLTTKVESPGSGWNVRFAQAMTFLSGIGSFGTLTLTLVGVSSVGEGVLLPLQVFAFATMLLAILLYYDLVRNKWPGIEDRYMEIDLCAGVVDPEFVPEDVVRLNVVTLEKRERLALSEGKKELAKIYRARIEQWKAVLSKRTVS